MKQDILILPSRMDRGAPTYDILAEYDIPATIVADVQDVLSELRTNTPAFLLLDLDTRSARSVIAEIEEQFFRPAPDIILVSSLSGSMDRASMIDQGVDVCIESPVDLSEVLAVIHSVLRRESRTKYIQAGSLLPCIEHRDLFIDPLRRQVRMRGQAICLTPKEFDLLHLLASNPGVVFSREKIFAHIWRTQDNLGASTVPDHISSLRQKLGLHHKNREYIQTVFKVSYRFAERI